MDRICSSLTRASVFFNAPLFSTAYKSKVHCIQMILVVVMMSFTGVRIATKPKTIPITRADTLGIVMGIKTLIVLSYQLVSTHIDKHRRWRKLKIYQILNTMEILFWLVVVIVTFMGISQYCESTYCGLSWLIAIIAMILTTFALWTAIVSRRLRRESKQVG